MNNNTSTIATRSENLDRVLSNWRTSIVLHKQDQQVGVLDETTTLSHEAEVRILARQAYSLNASQDDLEEVRSVGWYR